MSIPKTHGSNSTYLNYGCRCPECKQAHKEYGAEHRNQEYKSLSDFVATQKAGPCKDCGVRYPACVMEFDHLPQYEKVADISYMLKQRIGRARILEEIEKCDLVCANCHRIRTQKRMMGC